MLLNAGLQPEHQITEMKRKIILSITIVLIAGAVFAYYQYNRKPATAGERKVDFTYTANELYLAFEDEDAATKKLRDKVIEINGEVGAIEKNNGNYQVSLNTQDPITSITVLLIKEENENAAALKSGDKVKLRGICNGKLSDIELNKGVIIND